MQSPEINETTIRAWLDAEAVRIAPKVNDTLRDVRVGITSGCRPWSADVSGFLKNGHRFVNGCGATVDEAVERLRENIAKLKDERAA